MAHQQAWLSKIAERYQITAKEGHTAAIASGDQFAELAILEILQAFRAIKDRITHCAHITQTR